MSKLSQHPLSAWEGVCGFPLQGRLAKPRQHGLTSLIDKGLGLESTRDLLEMASPFIDMIKFAFGTSAFHSEEYLTEKIRLIRSYGVECYPGGTFLEVAAVQGRVRPFMERSWKLGFRMIEISDGTVPMTPEFRYELIQRALQIGFKVITEVGKKHPADRVPGTDIRRQIESDIEAGAYKVIIEGRESGKGVVIFRDDGSIDEDEMEVLVERLPNLDLLIWEAPLKGQQQDLILRFGPNVNLGNIPPSEILALECLRVGLRGDTLRAALLGHPDRFSNMLKLTGGSELSANDNGDG